MNWQLMRRPRNGRLITWLPAFLMMMILNGDGDADADYDAGDNDGDDDGITSLNEEA